MSETKLPFDPQPKQEVLVRARFINRATNKLWSWVRIEGADAPVAVYSNTLVSATEYAKAALDSAEQSEDAAPTFTDLEKSVIAIAMRRFIAGKSTPEQFTAAKSATEKLFAIWERAKQALRDTPKAATITVNMREHQVEGGTISYERVAELAGKPGATHLTMTYYWVGSERKSEISGSLIPGESALVRDGMHFCATNTSNA